MAKSTTYIFRDKFAPKVCCVIIGADSKEDALETARRKYYEEYHTKKIPFVAKNFRNQLLT